MAAFSLKQGLQVSMHNQGKAWAGCVLHPAPSHVHSSDSASNAGLMQVLQTVQPAPRDSELWLRHFLLLGHYWNSVSGGQGWCRGSYAVARSENTPVTR